MNVLQWPRRLWRAIRHTPGRAKRRESTAAHGGMGERELQLRLELLVPGAMESDDYNVYETARRLSEFGLHAQTSFLDATRKLVPYGDDFAFQFCKHGPAALAILSEREWSVWLTRMEAGLREKKPDAALACLRAPEKMLASERAHIASFADAAPVLRRLLAAYGATDALKLEVGEASAAAYTDTRTLFLPAQYERFATGEENFGLYKAATAFLWAQIVGGTWDVEIDALLYDFDDRERATLHFQRLECLRLDALLARELPGVARLLERLGTQVRVLNDDAWREAAAALQRDDARAEDSLAWTRRFMRAGTPPPEATLYQGRFDPVAVLRAQQELRGDAKDGGDTTDAAHAMPDNRVEQSAGLATATGQETQNAAARDDEALRFLRETDADPRPPEGADAPAQTPLPDDAVARPSGEAGETVVLQPEWDYTLGRYRNDWCRVLIRPAGHGSLADADDILQKNRGAVQRLRRHFESLRSGDRRLPRQPDGDELDTNAVVEHCVDRRSGRAPERNIYVRNHRDKRDVCIVFIIDVSASTHGWINAMEKEALLLLCEAIEQLDDRYAIYGFSGSSRMRCVLHCVKTFDDAYDAQVKARICGLQAADATRLGAAIRATGKMLADIPARTKLMISLSDGRPDDTDGYRGQYGIEDSRQALLEVTAHGIHPYCITINNREMDYLDYMYGRAATAVVNRVDKLPSMMVDFYRRLTVGR